MPKTVYLANLTKSGNQPQSVAVNFSEENCGVAARVILDGQPLPAHFYVEHANGEVILFIWDDSTRQLDSPHATGYSHRIVLAKLPDHVPRPQAAVCSCPPPPSPPFPGSEPLGNSSQSPE